MGLHVGLDIGVASVGWCVIDDDAKRIAGMGVRVFPRAENPKNGAPLAEPRRLARSARRRLKRRRQRMADLRALLINAGVLSEPDLARAFEVGPDDPTPYELRGAGLDRRLTPREWARVLTHLCNRRGYKSMRLAETATDDDGAVKRAIAENEAIMEARGYRTVGEMLLHDERFAESKRNKGDYKGAISRELLLDEVAALFDAQRRLGNPKASAGLEDSYVEVLSSQAAISEGPALACKVGRCSIDRVNPRIPSACCTFERFRVVDKLHNLRYTAEAGAPRSTLDDEQRATVFRWAFERKTPLTLADVRKKLGLPDAARFAGVGYGLGDTSPAEAESKVKLPHPKSWHRMKEAVESLDPGAWTGLAEDRALLDSIATVLTHFKLDGSVRRELASLGLEPDIVETLQEIRFSGHGHLSRETLLAILPYMEGGAQYSDACAAAGLDHCAGADGTRYARLPAVPADDIRNPVVLRALSQSRKVLNAIIDEFGSIEQLHIELAREVAKPYEDRREIEKRQGENRKRNEALMEDIRSTGGLGNPRPLTLLKFRLWTEQGGRCPYSGKYIDRARMLSEEPGVAEVDHILPHGRSFDDGFTNKVLVTAVENQRKRGKTPFEYLGGDPQRWHEFEERVRSMHLPRAKTERLLRTSFDERASEEFRERNLIDTQYTARYLKTFVEENLRFAGDKKRPVITVNGRATAYLRTGWQLQKVREDGDLHHALDAAVVAVTDHRAVQAVSRFFSVRPLRNNAGEYYDPATGEVIPARHVPEPWEGFSGEVAGKLVAPMPSDPRDVLASAPEHLRPIFVSRMPNRSLRGEVHKETVRRIMGEDRKGRIRTSKRMLLENLTPSLLETMVGKDQDRALYELLRDRLAQHAGDGRKAFSEPVYKPSRPGKTAPRVRHIRVEDQPASGGTFVRGGLADNGRMVRTDVFERDGKYYLVPVYMKDVAAGVLPMRAIVAGKAEGEWRAIDDSYRFAFSLHMDDLVCLVKKTPSGPETLFGYFGGTSRSTGAISLHAHDRSWQREGVGVAQGVLSFDKYHVDVLGRSIHTVKQEPRLGFSNGHHQQSD